MTIVIGLIAIPTADVIWQVVLIRCSISPDRCIDVVVELIALLRQESCQPLVPVPVLLVPVVILRQLVPMSNCIAKAMEVGNVRIGECEAGAPSDISTAECIKI